MYLSIEFKKIWKKIANNENISILRYGDGERAIMTGKSVIAQEGWRSPNYIGKLGNDLLKTLTLKGKNLYHGISCPCCDRAAFFWYKTRIHNQNITFANLFINTNYIKFRQEFEKITRKVIFIGNKNAEGKRIGNLNIIKSYYVPDDCFDFWDKEGESLLENIKKDYGNLNNLLYVISAGPLSEVIIAELYKNNPNNSYIDFGSALDEYIHGIKTRPYMFKNTKFAQSDCTMSEEERKEYNITVVLSAYKRIKNLEQQLKAIENQTIKPAEIILFQDKIEDGEEETISSSIQQRINKTEKSEKNVGCWGRFIFAKQASSELICIFDDDTIPGESWLENCFCEMQKKEGLYGTIGIIMKKPKTYPSKQMIRIGWDSSNKKTTQVDFVGHSWFFKKKWLDGFFESTKDLQELKIAGEDMGFSAHLQKKGIKTFVPPHPLKNRNLWGSIPEIATKLGTENSAISSSESNLNKMTLAMNKILNNGFIPLIKSNPLKTALMFHGMKSINFIVRLFTPKKYRYKTLLKLRGYICG